MTLNAQPPRRQGWQASRYELMDLTFLRTLSASNLPRSVPPGPAFQLVLAYQAAGLLDVTIPQLVRTRSGSSIQHDAVVTAITNEGLAALQPDKVTAE